MRAPCSLRSMATPIREVSQKAYCIVTFHWLIWKMMLSNSYPTISNRPVADFSGNQTAISSIIIIISRAGGGG
jgi:hypothetical protein